LEDEQQKLLMTLVSNSTIELDPEMSEEELYALVVEIKVYAEALKYKENSLKLRQETLMSIYQGNPNGTVRDMILSTNTMSMDLKREQMILNDVVEKVAEFSHVHGYGSV